MKEWFILLGFIFVFSFVQQSCTCRPALESVNIDGSSTVYVISEAIAEEYQKIHKGRVSIGISGTGGGFKKLCSKRVNLIGASRPINEVEAQLCEKNGIAPIEFSVATDGIVIAVNPRNTWAHEISVEMLKMLFEPEAEGTINYWSDLNPQWPRRKIAIFAPGISSGTYDYFTKVIVGLEHASRGDITSSEDDNVLVHGLRTNADSLGFFSFAYYQENRNDVRALPVINSNSQAIVPTKESVQNGKYNPLSRPVFVYADPKRLKDAERAFLRFYLDNSAKVASDVGFIPLGQEVHDRNAQKLAN